MMSPVADGKTFNFWAGGHVVYFECVLLVNMVLLRQTHNFTGWNELLIFLQVSSFFWLVYLDSILLKGPIMYFFYEYWSSKTAWLGVLFVVGILFIEKACNEALSLLNIKFSCSCWRRLKQVKRITKKSNLPDKDVLIQSNVLVLS